MRGSIDVHYDTRETLPAKFSMRTQESAEFGTMDAYYQNVDDGSQTQLLDDDKDMEYLKSVRKFRANTAKLVIFLLIVAMSSILYTSVLPKFRSSDKLLQSDAASSPNIVASSSSSVLSTSPNIVFILADDMGFNSLSYGVSPFLFELQKKSVSLTNYYAQETCTPGRASLLTGRYPLSIGAQTAEFSVGTSGGLNLDETLVSEVLQNNGYTTYLFGKWNLGNASPSYLPTARGFSYYLGYLDGFSSYWSKLIPDSTKYKDFLYSDTSCYYMYDSSDLTQYSTFLYQDKAVAAINSHDFSDPMFMFMSFQAVHDPFADDEGGFTKGIPSGYLTESAKAYIADTYTGTVENQYMKSLSVLDTAVSGIYDSLKSNGQLNNTYIIFASDNGGCPGGGGRNYPLRGTKGSLFEGGSHVESFVYSPMLSAMNYTSLFHVSDWFPTILGMADISYTATDDFALDGVSHFENFEAGLTSTEVREYMLYNYYHLSSEADVDPTSPFAIRNKQYKLMHTFASVTSGGWYSASEEYPANDDAIAAYASCSQATAMASGQYTYFLFDLLNDPYETVNLYDTTTDYTAVQNILLEQLALIEAAAHTTALSGADDDADTYVTWQTNSYYAVPWQTAVNTSSLIPSRANATAPSLCGLYSLMSETEVLKRPSFLDALTMERDSSE